MSKIGINTAEMVSESLYPLSLVIKVLKSVHQRFVMKTVHTD